MSAHHPDNATAGAPRSDTPGTTPEFSIKPLDGLHCLFLGEQSGPYIWGFLERGEAEAIAEALNRAVLQAAIRGCKVPHTGPQPLENEVAAWRARFPLYAYRPQADCVALKKEPEPPKCCVCGTTENLRQDGWYGHRCNSAECVCF